MNEIVNNKEMIKTVLMKKKILVSIASFGDKQLNLLNRVLDEYRSYQNYDVDIHVHTTVDLNRKDVRYTIYDPNTVGRMTYLHRQEFSEKRNDYDLFIYSENDMEIKESAVDLFLKYEDILPEDYVLGMLRYETHESDLNIYFPDLWPEVWHRPTKVNNTGRGSYIVHKKLGIGDKYYFILVNPHQSSYLLTQKKLNAVIDKTDFLNINFSGNETASCGPFAGWDHADGILYKAWTLDKEELQKCLIHHLSDNHKTTGVATWNSLTKDLEI